jgi:hypothetical protein
LVISVDAEREGITNCAGDDGAANVNVAARVDRAAAAESAAADEGVSV